MQPNSRILQNREVTSYCLTGDAGEVKPLTGDAGEVKPLEMPSVDDRAATHLRSMASVKEEKDHGYSMEASRLA